LHNQLAMEHVLDSGRCYTQVNVQFFGDFPAALDWLSRSSEDVQRLEQEWLAAMLATSRPSATALLPNEWID